ncbi:MAG: YkgJ family cysteine cluster protein [Endozoicomonas sp.]|uniref:YkgJ family cysteine cluster protein n=1 Tax=Endozoicomonas sp. TaxID=1892382 RepID=UPI003D9B39D7
MSFPCTRCGLCCKNIKHIEPLSRMHNGDGVCVHYSPEIGCAIYDKRPIHCRIDEGYEILFSQIVEKHEYYQKNADVCNQLQRATGMDSSFRIEL